MPKIHLAPLLSLVAGSLGLVALDRLSSLSAAGWTAGFLYLVVSDGLLARGLHRSGMSEVGWGNWATTPRSTLEGYVIRGDFSRWIADVFGDHPLAQQLRGLEDRHRADRSPETLAEIASAVRARYDLVHEPVDTVEG